MGAVAAAALQPRVGLIEMLEFVPGRRLRHVLLVGAHADDIEIGAGGTVLKMLTERTDLQVTWVVLAAHGQRRQEAEASATRFLGGAASYQVHLGEFRERYFPYQQEIKEYFDALGEQLDPDIVFSPRLDDAHQDHRTVAELAKNTFRDQSILQYEIVKTDGDLGQPSLYVNLPIESVERKVDLLMEMFPSQHTRKWFDPELFKGIMRLRGVEGRAGSGFAEAFHSTNLVISP